MSGPLRDKSPDLSLLKYQSVAFQVIHRGVCVLACVSVLTGSEDGGDVTTPLGSGDGLQSHIVLCGSSQLSHVVRGRCRA